jgi:hypothetical protein
MEIIFVLALVPTYQTILCHNTGGHNINLHPVNTEYPSETSVPTFQTTLCHNLGNLNKKALKVILMYLRNKQWRSSFLVRFERNVYV